MSTEKVPADLWELAKRADAEYQSGSGFSQADWCGSLRAVLAAVLPVFERQVRESIADDFEGGGVMTNAEISDWRRLRDTDSDHESCLELWVRYSARIARGER